MIFLKYLNNATQVIVQTKQADCEREWRFIPLNSSIGALDLVFLHGYVYTCGTTKIIQQNPSKPPNCNASVWPLILRDTQTLPLSFYVHTGTLVYHCFVTVFCPTQTSSSNLLTASVALCQLWPRTRLSNVSFRPRRTMAPLVEGQPALWPWRRRREMRDACFVPI